MAPVPFRYRKPGYVALNVSDVGRTAAFAQDIVGLEDSGTGPDGQRYFRCGPDRHCIVLYKSDQPGFKRGAFELESEADVERAFGYYTDLGWRPEWLGDEERIINNLTLTPAFRVQEKMTGATFEYYGRMDQTIVRFPARLAKIQRLGHFALSVPDVVATAKHMEQTMGFIVSDYVSKFAALMRAFPNPNHHSFALAFSSTGKPHFNHVNFMVSDIDDVGSLKYRLERHQIKIVFGMGRHPTSDSVFLYFLDPDGLTWEYSYGMEQFPETGYRQARAMSARPEDFDVWGARPEPEFSKTGVIERADAGVAA
jgi:2,3-dihydroxy-p-cumate/2,3-dihydroxybenzoate 3,4-dioxygenase